MRSFSNFLVFRCMTPLLPSWGSALPSLLDDDSGAGADDFWQFGGIPVGHADAASAAASANFIGPVGAVDADAGSAESHPMNADWVVRSSGNGQASRTALAGLEQ